MYLLLPGVHAAGDGIYAASVDGDGNVERESGVGYRRLQVVVRCREPCLYHHDKRRECYKLRSAGVGRRTNVLLRRASLRYRRVNRSEFGGSLVRGTRFDVAAEPD